MLWGWILKRCTDDVQNTGLWGYLASRARDKSRVNLDRSHTEGTMRLVDRLPYGAVVREGTADTWREIRMPDPPAAFSFYGASGTGSSRRNANRA